MGTSEGEHMRYFIRKQIYRTFPEFSDIRKSKMVRRTSMAMKQNLKFKRLSDITPERLKEAEEYVSRYVKGLRYEYRK